MRLQSDRRALPGKLGEGMDRVVMHRLAQITMSDFLTRLAAALAIAVGAAFIS